MIRALVQEVRQSLRSIARRPTFAGTAVGLLGLGMAACTMIFCVVYTLLPRPFYKPCVQRPLAYATLQVRAASGHPAEALTSAVERVIWRLDPDQPIGKVTTLTREVGASVIYARPSVALFGGFAALALILAAPGTYGSVAYAVSQRTREFGIRLALGARRRDVLRLVLGPGNRLVLLGVAISLIATVALSGVLKSLLYGVDARDPVTLSLVAIVLGTVALLASYLLARPATILYPLTVLRED